MPSPLAGDSHCSRVRRSPGRCIGGTVVRRRRAALTCCVAGRVSAGICAVGPGRARSGTKGAERVAQNQFDMIDTLIDNQREREVVARIVAGRHALSDTATG